MVTGFSPYMLYHARPARNTMGRMVDGSTHPTWGAGLQLQADIMAKAAKAPEESRHHNREWLPNKANAKLFKVGDCVMIKGQ